MSVTLTLSRPSSVVKVIGQGSISQEEIVAKVVGVTSTVSFLVVRVFCECECVCVHACVSLCDAVIQRNHPGTWRSHLWRRITRMLLCQLSTLISIHCHRSVCLSVICLVVHVACWTHERDQFHSFCANVSMLFVNLFTALFDLTVTAADIQNMW